MYDPNYQLTPQRARRTRRPSRWLVVMLVVVMVAAGAVAGPLLLPNGEALAMEPATVQTAGQIDAPRTDLAQIENSSLFADQEALANLYEQVLPSVCEHRSAGAGGRKIPSLIRPTATTCRKAPAQAGFMTPTATSSPTTTWWRMPSGWSCSFITASGRKPTWWPRMHRPIWPCSR